MANIIQHAQEYFKRNDDNGSGYIDKEELRHFFLNYAKENDIRPPLETDFAQEICVYKSKNEREFSREEFCHLCTILSKKLRPQ